MTRRGAHAPVAAFRGGPQDGGRRHCGLLLGFLPDGFEEPACPEGEYVLAQTVTHADGSLCGGVYRWEVRS